jgi:prepilin-type N-terminal cleavage/methylation domain-containing protein
MRKAFTLIEILVAMTVIATLSVISFSVASSVIDRAKQTSAIHQIKLIETAIRTYRMEYGHVPVSSKLRDSEIPLATNKKDGKELIQCIMGETSGSFVNRRQIRFYEPNEAIEGKNGWDEKIGLVDPWGNPYWILVDADGDGVLDITVLPSTNASWHRSEKSKGKNKNNNKYGFDLKEIRRESAILSEGDGESPPITSWSQ